MAPAHKMKRTQEYGAICKKLINTRFLHSMNKLEGTDQYMLGFCQDHEEDSKK